MLINKKQNSKAQLFATETLKFQREGDSISRLFKNLGSRWFDRLLQSQLKAYTHRLNNNDLDGYSHNLCPLFKYPVAVRWHPTSKVIVSNSLWANSPNKIQLNYTYNRHYNRAATRHPMYETVLFAFMVPYKRFLILAFRNMIIKTQYS